MCPKILDYRKRHATLRVGDVNGQEKSKEEIPSLTAQVMANNSLFSKGALVLRRFRLLPPNPFPWFDYRHLSVTRRRRSERFQASPIASVTVPSQVSSRFSSRLK